MSNKFASILSAFEGNISESAGARKRPAGCDQETLLVVPLDRIVADPNQPRREFDQEELYRLAGSLKSKGQLQPIVCRYDDQLDKFVIVAGERRWRAAQIAGLRSLNVVEDTAPRDALQTVEVQLAENLVRADLAPIDQARAYRQLMDARGWTAAQLAESLNVDASVVSRALAMLELPEAVQEKINAGEIKGKQLREAVRRKPSKTKKGKPLSRTFNVSGAKIIVTYKRSDVPPHEIASALRAAADMVAGEQREAA